MVVILGKICLAKNGVKQELSYILSKFGQNTQILVTLKFFSFVSFSQQFKQNHYKYRPRTL